MRCILICMCIDREKVENVVYSFFWVLFSSLLMYFTGYFSLLFNTSRLNGYIYIFSISPYDDYSCNLNRFFIHLGEILFVVFMLIYFYFGYYLIYVKRITMDWEDYQPVCNLELICECPIRVWFVFLFSSMFCPIYGMDQLFLIISK